MIKNKWFRTLLLFVLVMTVAYLVGPNPKTPVYDKVLPSVPGSANELIQYISENESKHKIKPNNEARIIWFNDTLRTKTEYAIVYLHGFSASQEEGHPIHVNIARTFGCNLYLSRLAEHGIDTTVDLINLTPEKYWQSAEEALQIGRQIGNKVVLMATSTGGTLALKLAADYPEYIAGLVLLSPNVAINNDKAYLLNNPWGLQIARMVTGDNNVTSKDDREIYKQYWNYTYPLEATVQLQELIETTMTPETFQNVKAPLQLLYFFKDEMHQDSVVSVPAMLNMYAQIGTPDSLKQKKALPNVNNHVIGSYIKSADLLSVQQSVESFMKSVLKMEPVKDYSSLIRAEAKVVIQ
jgi:esterase/lipase